MDIITCPCCGFSSADHNEFYDIGACEGNVFCPACVCEFSLETGKETPLCGSANCGGCQSLINLGCFDAAQRARKEHLDA